MYLFGLYNSAAVPRVQECGEEEKEFPFTGSGNTFPQKKIFPVLPEYRMPGKTWLQILAEDNSCVFRRPRHDRSLPERFGHYERNGCSEPFCIDRCVQLFG